MQLPIPLPVVQQSNLALWLAFIGSTISTLVGAFVVVIVNSTAKRQAASNVRQEQHLVEIQTFTNSALGMSMKVAAGALRRVADITKESADADIATKAEAQASAHEAAQRVVDAQIASRPVPH